jgi:hypothetical protein
MGQHAVSDAVHARSFVGMPRQSDEDFSELIFSEGSVETVSLSLFVYLSLRVLTKVIAITTNIRGCVWRSVGLGHADVAKVVVKNFSLLLRRQS